MPKPCEYVVSSALAKCTKGEKNSNMKCFGSSKIKGKEICTFQESACTFSVSFGICSETGEECIPDITEFEDIKTDVSFTGVPSLLVKSKGTCSIGGEISFITSGQDISIERLLELLRKIEEAYPDWDREDILSGLLGLGGYAGGDFPALIGTDPNKKIIPRDILTQNDIDELKNMLAHSIGGGIQTGIVMDRTGKKVAMGHVLVGIMAGLHRNKNKNMDTIGGIDIPFIGESVDNLYASTLAGDLGKWAARTNQGENIPPIGTEGSGVSRAELTGDIDALIIGEMLSDEDNRNAAWSPEQPLSGLLNTYYTRYDGTRFQNAVHWLPELYGENYVTDQINRFAIMYTYAHYRSTVKGRWGGALAGFKVGGVPGGIAGFFAGERVEGIWNELFNNTKDDSESAFNAYQDWMESEYEEEQNTPEPYSPGGLVTDGSC